VSRKLRTEQRTSLIVGILRGRQCPHRAPEGVRCLALFEHADPARVPWQR
jgi:hypothetical protein